MNARIEQRDKAHVDKAVNYSIGWVRGLIPGSNLPFISDLLDDAEEEARKKAREAAQRSPEAKKAASMFSDLVDMLQDFVIGLIDSIFSRPSSVEARNGMLAKIGLDAKGNSKGDNPFAGLDKSLGVEVSNDIQALCETKIRDLIGWTGMRKGTDSATQTALDIRGAVETKVFDALFTKYGKSAADEPALRKSAQQVATTITGIDPETAASSKASELLAKNPPQKGIAKLLIQTAASETRSIAILEFDQSHLGQAVAQLNTLRTTTADASKAHAAAQDPAARDAAATAVRSGASPAPTGGQTPPPGAKPKSAQQLSVS